MKEMHFYISCILHSLQISERKIKEKAVFIMRLYCALPFSEANGDIEAITFAGTKNTKSLISFKKQPLLKSIKI